VKSPWQHISSNIVSKRCSLFSIICYLFCTFFSLSFFITIYNNLNIYFSNWKNFKNVIISRHLLNNWALFYFNLLFLDNFDLGELYRTTFLNNCAFVCSTVFNWIFNLFFGFLSINISLLDFLSIVISLSVNKKIFFHFLF
jgi:hypothetical protein